MDTQQLEMFLKLSGQISALHGQIDALTDAVATLLADHLKKDFDDIIKQFNEKAHAYGMKNLELTEKHLLSTFQEKE